MKLKILDTRFRDEWPLPGPSTPGSAGVDLRAANLDGERLSDGFYLGPDQCVMVGTGLAFWLQDPRYAGLVLPRSGWAHKHGLILGNGTGVLDSDYQGELKVSFWNRSSETRYIAAGDRIAQLVITMIAAPEFRIVKNFETTERGKDGFGSTGVA